jgi:hypothetical protein
MQIFLRKSAFAHIVSLITCMSLRDVDWITFFEALFMTIVKWNPSVWTNPLFDTFSVNRIGWRFFRNKEIKPRAPELSLKRKAGVWQSGRLFKSKNGFIMNSPRHWSRNALSRAAWVGHANLPIGLRTVSTKYRMHPYAPAKDCRRLVIGSVNLNS